MYIILAKKLAHYRKNRNQKLKKLPTMFLVAFWLELFEIFTNKF